jgi:hypothetical protein
MPRRAPLLLILAATAGCGSEVDIPDDVDRLRTETDSFGIVTCSPATETTTCFTHRAVLGVSMGAGGSGQLGFMRPELFDTVGLIGSPLVDWIYFLRNVKHSYLGGFCDRETILANVAEIADPAGRAFCGPVEGSVRITPDGSILEPTQDFNHWWRWIDQGRGGSFGRNKLRESLQDVSLAYGNALSYNPDSPYYPPGLPIDYRSWSDEEKCARPLVLEGVKHHEYNPDGTYDVIAFCDTYTSSGDFDPARPSEAPAEVLLAVDYNANGIRDYAEPVLVMMHERFEDTGVAPGDDYDWATNPTGTAGDWRWEEGEPFEDTGLDGVAGTGDYGEGNGRFDYNPNVENYLHHNPRSNLEIMEEGHLERLNIYADAGIRDFLMSAGATNWMWGSLVARTGADVARQWDDFPSLTPELSRFDFLSADYSPAGIGKHAYVRYGDPNADEREIARGDGHHVGPADQVLNRFLVALSFVQSRFLEPDLGAVESVGEITDLVQPRTFFSNALGRERKYGIVLPPGYDHPDNAEKRYPVVYFLHGQGMESQDLLASAILFFGYMAGSTREEQMRRREADWAKFIIVFPDSTCDQDACSSGNFNANHLGVDGNGPRYLDSHYELIAHVEQSYRTAIPVEVPKDRGF